jgi:hypothetical protein
MPMSTYPPSNFLNKLMKGEDNCTCPCPPPPKSCKLCKISRIGSVYGTERLSVSPSAPLEKTVQHSNLHLRWRSSAFVTRFSCTLLACSQSGTLLTCFLGVGTQR